jgi:hypothetical protein
MRYAIVKDGVVVNVIEYDEQPTNPPAGFEEGYEAIQADNVSPSWLYANGQFTNPNPPEIIPIYETQSLADIVLANPTELQKLKQALGIA